MPYSSDKVQGSNANIDTSGLAQKVAIVTGGANGLGKAYVQALHAAGLHVCVGDLNVADGDKLASELPGVKFARCDVTSWDDQVNLFKTAASMSPSGSVHHVIANAGIAVADDVFTYDGPDYPTSPPNLKTIEINLHGALYTTKLALHSFMRQNGTDGPKDSQEDTSLTLIGSGAAFLDCPRGPQYEATKWGARGIMHTLRRTAHYHGSRVNLLSPWYVRTLILPESAFKHVEDAGVEFATGEDGGRLLLRLLSDKSINGRHLFLAPRKWAPNGYLDLDIDDYKGNELMEGIQADQLKGAPVEDGLFLPQRW